MTQTEQASILVIGTDVAPEHKELAGEVMTADTGRRAIELLRMLKFDLVVISHPLPDMPAWNLIQRVRMTMPWQKWALVGREISQRDELTARSLGVVGVFDQDSDWPEILHVAAAIHRRASTAVAGGRRSVAEPVRVAWA
jgi:DNA-binding response OmpR family regulator